MDSIIQDIDRIIQGIVIFALPVTLAITLHEAAHGYVAKKFGDLTAYAQGRVTLNPLKHGNLRHPKRDMLWVAAAGPGANLLMAFLWALVFKFGLTIPESNFSEPMLLMGQAGILVNVILLVLNLLPLPPLDGGRIAMSLLPQRIAYRFAQIEPYGFIILLVLLFTGVLGAVIEPFIFITIRLVAWVTGLQI